MTKRKKNRKKIVPSYSNPLSNSLIMVPCWSPDIPEYEKEAYSNMWKADIESVKRFFKSHRKVNFKRVSTQICLKYSKIKSSSHENCYGCTKFLKYLLPESTKKRKRKKIHRKIRRLL